MTSCPPKKPPYPTISLYDYMVSGQATTSQSDQPAYMQYFPKFSWSFRGTFTPVCACVWCFRKLKKTHNFKPSWIPFFLHTLPLCTFLFVSSLQCDLWYTAVCVCVCVCCVTKFDLSSVLSFCLKMIPHTNHQFRIEHRGYHLPSMREADMRQGTTVFLKPPQACLLTNPIWVVYRNLFNLWLINTTFQFQEIACFFFRLFHHRTLHLLHCWAWIMHYLKWSFEKY